MYKRIMQVVIFIVLVVVVMSWSLVERGLTWLSGQDEITIVSKTTSSGCYGIVDSEDNNYCLNKESYDLAIEGQNFLIDEYEGYHILRRVDNNDRHLQIHVDLDER